MSNSDVDALLPKWARKIEILIEETKKGRAAATSKVSKNEEAAAIAEVQKKEAAPQG